MNFGKNATERALRNAGSKTEKLRSFFAVAVARVVFACFIMGAALCTACGIGMISGIIDSAPEIDPSAISPLGFATTVYDSAGNVTETLVMAGSNREEASYDELPEDLINASGGGSTITQQLIKNNVFNGGREKTFGEKLERKIQEQYLALKLEQVMDKTVIMTNYLNTINLGNNALGVKSQAAHDWYVKSYGANSYFAQMPVLKQLSTAGFFDAMGPYYGFRQFKVLERIGRTQLGGDLVVAESTSSRNGKKL